MSIHTLRGKKVNLDNNLAFGQGRDKTFPSCTLGEEKNGLIIVSPIPMDLTQPLTKSHTKEKKRNQLRSAY